MNEISVCAVIYNEAEYLEESFNQLKPYVDDFVVIDQESTDNSVEIAKKFTKKVYLFPRVYYAYAYIHEAMLMAKHTWILKCDPDERWDKVLLEQFKDLIKTDNDIIKFRMMYGGDSKTFNPRLFKRGRVIWTDSLDAKPYRLEMLKVFEVEKGLITNLRGPEESMGRYRLEAAKRLLVRYGDTKIKVYKNLCGYYKELVSGKREY